MAAFNSIRPGYEKVKVIFDWDVQVPFLRTTGRNGTKISSSLFSPKETPDSKWRLSLSDLGTQISIQTWLYNAANQIVNIVEPVLVKISILNKKKNKVFQQIGLLSISQYSDDLQFQFTKEMVIKSQCQQADGSYIFSCKIISHVKKEPVWPSVSSAVDINCSNGLSTQLEGLFHGMQFSDVIVNINGRKFPAHKSILAARSNVFAAMFQHPTKEKLTNQITIQDVKPEVFQELLHFIYTGRVPMEEMETMAAGLFIAADKYLLDELKMECQNYLLHQMSPENCIVLLLHGGDLLNPAEHLMKAAKFFLRFPLEVMATDEWKKMKKKNPALLFEILEFVHLYK